PVNQKQAAVTNMRDVLSRRFGQSDWARILERGGVYEEAPHDWSPYSAPLYPPTIEAAADAEMPAAVPMWDGLKATVPLLTSPQFKGGGNLVLVPYPSPVGGDGSIANRPWVPE